MEAAIELYLRTLSGVCNGVVNEWFRPWLLRRLKVVDNGICRSGAEPISRRVSIILNWWGRRGNYEPSTRVCVGNKGAGSSALTWWGGSKLSSNVSGHLM